MERMYEEVNSEEVDPTAYGLGPLVSEPFGLSCPTISLTSLTPLRLPPCFAITLKLPFFTLMLELQKL